MDTPAGLVERARAAERQGLLRQAITYYQAATRLDPPLWTAFSQYGTLAYRSRDYELARRLLERAVELKPDQAEVVFRLGTCLEALGQRERAVAAFQRAVALAPGSWVPWFVIAAEHQLVGNLEVAQAALRRVLQEEPDQVDALSALGSLLRDAGDHAAAYWLFRRAYLQCRLDPRCVTDYALGEMERGEWETARGLLEEAKALDPGDPAIDRAQAELLRRGPASGPPLHRRAS